jgi:hypothetical protein
LSDSSQGFADTVVGWMRDKISSFSTLTLDNSIAQVKEYGAQLWESSKSVFRYLSGVPVTPPQQLPPIEMTEEREERKESWWAIAGLFGSLNGKRR